MWRDFQRFTAGCAIILACVIHPALAIVCGVVYVWWRLALPKRQPH